MLKLLAKKKKIKFYLNLQIEIKNYLIISILNLINFFS